VRSQPRGSILWWVGFLPVTGLGVLLATTTGYWAFSNSLAVTRAGAGPILLVMAAVLTIEFAFEGSAILLWLRADGRRVGPPVTRPMLVALVGGWCFAIANVVFALSLAAVA
jgi:hypothetical protein